MRIYLRRGTSMFADAALAEYRRCFSDPDTIHAMCEDYRAGAGIDMRLDVADQDAQRRIPCPVQALWGRQGLVGKLYDVLAIWRDWANVVEGQAIDSGHYLAEEAPDETLAALKPFLAKAFAA